MATLLLSSAFAGQINYLILVLTTRCNLRCRYRYHGDPETRLAWIWSRPSWSGR